MSLAQYLKSFSRLRTYKDREKWSVLTIWQAPHKPFLLLDISPAIIWILSLRWWFYQTFPKFFVNCITLRSFSEGDIIDRLSCD